MNELLKKFTEEIEQEIQSMNTIDELLEHLVRSEALKWNRIRDYLIMKQYIRYVNGDIEHKNTKDFIVNMSIKFDCSYETVKNIIYRKEQCIKSLTRSLPDKI